MEALSTMFSTTSGTPVCGPTVEGRDLPGRTANGVCVPEFLGATAPVPRSTAGYYTYSITPLDQAGNRSTTIRRQILVDSIAPAITVVTLPQQLAPGEEFSVQTQASDNLDLVRVGAQLVFPNESRTGFLALPFAQDTAVGQKFDLKLTTASATSQRFPFVRSLTYPPSGVDASRTTVIVDSLQVRATDAAGLEAVADRLVSRASFGNDTSTLDPFPTFSSATTSVDRVLVCTAGCRSADPTSLTVKLRVIDESTTGGLPFARVYVFRRGPSGRIRLLGPPTSTSQTVQTATQRTVTYTFPYSPEPGLSGSYALFAVGVQSGGAAMITEYRAGASNTVQFFTRDD
jgi:hypothetical protein